MTGVGPHSGAQQELLRGLSKEELLEELRRRDGLEDGHIGNGNGAGAGTARVETHEAIADPQVALAATASGEHVTHPLQKVYSADQVSTSTESHRPRLPRHGNNTLSPFSASQVDKALSTITSALSSITSGSGTRPHGKESTSPLSASGSTTPVLRNAPVSPSMERLRSQDHTPGLDSSSSVPGSGTSTPKDHPVSWHPPKSLRPFVLAIMAFKNGQKFARRPSEHRKRRLSTAIEKRGLIAAPALATYFLGISAVFSEDRTAIIAMAIHDTVYLLDFSVKTIALNAAMETGQDIIADYIISEVQKYEHENFCKFIGAGLPSTLRRMSPTLCSRLWLETDIVSIVMHSSHDYKKNATWDVRRVDEQADSMARKCIMFFGPSMAPLLQVGFRGIVQSDAAFRAHINTLRNHQDTCGEPTWDSMMTYAKKLRGKHTKIAFFSSTPQGGGVALMRHALVRFSRLMNVDLTWYVPKPRPGVFRITKNIHNILQGVSPPGQRISALERDEIIDWIADNANRYWFSEGGPLCAPDDGGADIIYIDDPQMPGLIPMIKKLTPDRPVIYRSHIQIRGDLAGQAGTPQAEIWGFLWSMIQHADMFISHPIPAFVPAVVPKDMVAYMPATTDWLDGLNKPMNAWDSGYYGHVYNQACHAQHMVELDWPARKYIVQVARFDPSKGIPTVVDSYAEFRRRWNRDTQGEPPQLVIAGNGSVDDPDANNIHDMTIAQLEKDYPHLMKDVSVMRLEANDQVLNALIAHAHVVLQLSTREGFEVKVSEALHAGRPVIATKAGGIPLQVKDRVNGFLVNPGDWKQVAQHLIELFTDEELHERMSIEASNGVSDEVGTPGNALCWYYLAAKWLEIKAEDPKGKLLGKERWVNDLAREEAGHPYTEGENRLPRKFTERRGDALVAEGNALSASEEKK